MLSLPAGSFPNRKKTGTDAILLYMSYHTTFCGTCKTDLSPFFRIFPRFMVFLTEWPEKEETDCSRWILIVK